MTTQSIIAFVKPLLGGFIVGLGVLLAYDYIKQKQAEKAAGVLPTENTEV